MVNKAPSSWRREGSEEPASRVPRSGSQKRFQIDNPHDCVPIDGKRARSTSLNPVVYPQWWGEDQEVDPAYYRRDRAHIPKRLKSADIHKAKVYRNVAKHCEDTLDRRLRQVHEHDDDYEEVEPVAFRGEQQQLSQHGSVPKMNGSYHYTNMANVSPIRPGIAGQNNIPMTYQGPPSQQEINRNKGRVDYNRRSFEFGYDHPQQPGPAAPVEDGAGIRRRRGNSRSQHPLPS